MWLSSRQRVLREVHPYEVTRSQTGVDKQDTYTSENGVLNGNIVMVGMVDMKCSPELHAARLSSG